MDKNLSRIQTISESTGSDTYISTKDNATQAVDLADGVELIETPTQIKRTHQSNDKNQLVKESPYERFGPTSFKLDRTENIDDNDIERFYSKCSVCEVENHSEADKDNDHFEDAIENKLEKDSRPLLGDKTVKRDKIVADKAISDHTGPSVLKRKLKTLRRVLTKKKEATTGKVNTPYMMSIESDSQLQIKSYDNVVCRTVSNENHIVLKMSKKIILDKNLNKALLSLKKKEVNKESSFNSSITAAHCAIINRLMPCISKENSHTPDAKVGVSKPEPFTKKLKETPIVHEHNVRLLSSKNHLTHSIEPNSINLIWNNRIYPTSSSTVFELMQNVYKDSDTVFKSKSEVTQRQAQAWLILKTKESQIQKHRSNKAYEKNMEVSIFDEKWVIGKSKAFSHKIEIVLRSKFDKFMKQYSSEYIRIDIPKGFFLDSDKKSSEIDSSILHERFSDEKVCKITQYETKSDLYKPQNTCDKPINTEHNGVGVEVINQKDTSEVSKPIWNAMAGRFAEHRFVADLNYHERYNLGENYLQEYCRHCPSFDVDQFSCTDDSQLKCFSSICKGSYCIQYETKSCPNICDDLLKIKMSFKIGHINRHNCAQSCYWFEKIIRKMAYSDGKEDKPEKNRKEDVKFGIRVVPKDSIEVYNKRKIYAASNKSKWKVGTESENPSCSEICAEFKEPDLSSPVNKKPCQQKKRVCLPDCKEMRDLIVKMSADRMPEGILTFKSNTPCPSKKQERCKINPIPSHSPSPCSRPCDPTPCPAAPPSVCPVEHPPPCPAVSFPCNPQPCGAEPPHNHRQPCSAAPNSSNLQTCPNVTPPCPALSPPYKESPPCEKVPSSQKLPNCEKVPSCQKQPPCNEITPCQEVTTCKELPSCDELVPFMELPPCKEMPSCSEPPSNKNASEENLQPCHTLPLHELAPCEVLSRPNQCLTKEEPSLIASEKTSFIHSENPCNENTQNKKPQSVTCQKPPSASLIKPSSAPCKKPPQSPACSDMACKEPLSPTPCLPTSPPCKHGLVPNTCPHQCKRYPCAQRFEGIQLKSIPSHCNPISCSRSDDTCFYTPVPCPKELEHCPGESHPCSPCTDGPLSCPHSSDCPISSHSPTCLQYTEPPPHLNNDRKFPQVTHCPHCVPKSLTVSKKWPKTPPCVKHLTSVSPGKSYPMQPPSITTPFCTTDSAPHPNLDRPCNIQSCQTGRNLIESSTALTSFSSPHPSGNTYKCGTAATKATASFYGQSNSQPYTLASKASTLFLDANKGINRLKVKMSCDSIPPSPQPSLKCNESCPNPDKKLETSTPIPDKLPSPPTLLCPVPSPVSPNTFQKVKLTGVHIKVPPSSKGICSSNCPAWGMPKTEDCVSINSEEKIIIRVKKDKPNKRGYRDCVNIKVQDENGAVLYERKGYTPIADKTNGLLGDLYKDSNVHRLATPLPYQTEYDSYGSHETLEQKNSKLSAIEIQFTITVHKNDNIVYNSTCDENEYDSDTSDPPIGADTQEVFQVKDPDILCNEAENEKNDINICIIIRNLKSKERKNRYTKCTDYSKEFHEQIAAKYHPVSIGNSDTDQTGEKRVFSVHRTSVDSTSSVTKLKTQNRQVEKVTSELMPNHESITVIAARTIKSACLCSIGDKLSNIDAMGMKLKLDNEKLNQSNLTQKKFNSDEIKQDIQTRETNTGKDNVSITLCKEKLDIDIKERLIPEYHTLKTTDIEFPDIILEMLKNNEQHNAGSDEVNKKRVKDRDKQMLKQMLMKTYTEKKYKKRIKKLRDMLRVILSYDSSDLDEGNALSKTNSELARDTVFSMLKSNCWRYSVSKNNYYRVKSNSQLMPSQRAFKVVYPIQDNRVCVFSEVTLNKLPQSELVCMCSAVAEKLKLTSWMSNIDGCCYCNKPLNRTVEICCDLDNSGCCQVEDRADNTPNSKKLANKLTSTSKTCHCRVKLPIGYLWDGICSSIPSTSIKRQLIPGINYSRVCETQKIKRNAVFSDKHKMVFLSTEATRASKEVDMIKGREMNERTYVSNKTDILESYEIKKAVLELYRENTTSNGGTVAKLPKFLYDTESELHANYNAIIAASFLAADVCKTMRIN